MYVISLAALRRRFGPLLRTFLIAATILWALFVASRWFISDVSTLAPSGRGRSLWSPSRGGESALHAERFRSMDTVVGLSFSQV